MNHVFMIVSLVSIHANKNRIDEMLAIGGKNGLHGLRAQQVSFYFGTVLSSAGLSSACDGLGHRAPGIVGRYPWQLAFGRVLLCGSFSDDAAQLDLIEMFHNPYDDCNNS